MELDYMCIIGQLLQYVRFFPQGMNGVNWFVIYDL